MEPYISDFVKSDPLAQAWEAVRQTFWQKVWITAASVGENSSYRCTEIADAALRDFDTRFTGFKD